jgi:hypothetical protein
MIQFVWAVIELVKLNLDTVFTLSQTNVKDEHEKHMIHYIQIII